MLSIRTNDQDGTAAKNIENSLWRNCQILSDPSMHSDDNRIIEETVELVV